MGLDAHSVEQGRLLEEHVLTRRAELAREAHEQWSAAGPHSVSPFVPCAASRIPVLLRSARLSASDVLWDLGCGDGRVLHQAAAQYGCRCVGVDIDAACIAEARRRADEQGVGGRCTFYACDLLRLAPGALLDGTLGAAAEAAAVGPRLPPPTVAVVFVTGHALSRMNRFLHGEWAGASGALRLLTCVESLDSCVDFEAGDALFGAERPRWPISRAFEVIRYLITSSLLFRSSAKTYLKYPA
ncbi:S-adenosyl-L-methionine-dependent methyltransferase [Pavlovales sp. CCMP2436]|nr:S-adenosyl-L-methionine-dependent methyltransferase [Pavlovales sp. CCMP2436]